MTLCELAEAISIDAQDSQRDVEKMVTDPFDLLEMLESLVVVEQTTADPVVLLVHYTLDEFLESDQLRKHETLSVFHIPLMGIYEVGMTLAQYLSFAEFRKPCTTDAELDSRLACYPLLDLAAKQWFVQIRSYGGRGPLIKKDAQKMQWFIAPDEEGHQNFISWQQVYCGKISNLPTPNPLLSAEMLGMINLFDIIIQMGANTAVLSDNGYSPLAIAVLSGQEDRVASLLQSQQYTDIEQSYALGATCLHLAAGYGHTGIVRLLLKAGASPFARSESGSTPFYRAARGGSIPTLTLLLEAGSEVNAETWNGWTPIFEAIENQHVEVVQWLIQNGANLHQKIDTGVSVLKFAGYAGSADIVRLIETALSSL